MEMLFRRGQTKRDKAQNAKVAETKKELMDVTVTESIETSHLRKESSGEGKEWNPREGCNAILNCPPFQSGSVHQWSIQVLKNGRNLQLGVISTRCVLDKDEGIGFQEDEQAWALCNGFAMHNGSVCQQNLPRFTDRTTVTFTLDLTGSGILKASMNDKAFEIASGLRKGHGKKDGFLPAMSILDDDICPRIEFLGLKQIS